MTFHAFSDRNSSYTLDNLTLENQGDRLSIYGSLQITADQQGLAHAKQLQQYLHQAIHYLEQQNLPQKLPTTETTEEIDNPFWQNPE